MHAFFVRRWRLWALLVALPLLAIRCHKDDPKPIDRLPPATTSGANTWGCLVNGEAWTNSGPDNVRADWTVPDGMSISLSFSSRHILLDFPDTTNSYSLKNGTYTLVTNGQRGSHALVRVVRQFYDGSNLTKGTVHLTRLDRQAGIVSGTFDFVIVGGPGDTLRVTNGRFDIGHMDR